MKLFSQKNAHIVILSIFIISHIPYLFLPITGQHLWRQSDVAGVAKNFYQESMNILHPRVDARKDTTGITAMEAPIFNYAIALIYYTFGGVWDGVGKILAILSAVGVFILLGALIKKLFAIELLYSYSMLLLIPLFYKMTGRIMPETFGLLLGLLGQWYLLKDYEKPSYLYYIPAFFFFGLCVLVRPFFFPLLLPVVILFFHTLITKKKLLWQYALASAIIFIPFYWWYFPYRTYLLEHYKLTFFYFGTSLDKILPLLASFSFWKSLLLFLGQEYIGWVTLPIVALGIYGIHRALQADTLSRKNTPAEIRSFLHAHTAFSFQTDALPIQALAPAYTWPIALLTITVITLLTGNHYFRHGYYIYALIPAIVVYGGAGFQIINRRYAKAFPYIVSACIIITILNLSNTYRMNTLGSELRNFRMHALKDIGEDECFAIIDRQAYSYNLYMIRRKGWVVPREQLHDPNYMLILKHKNVAYVIDYNYADKQYQLYPIDEWLTTIQNE